MKIKLDVSCSYTVDIVVDDVPDDIVEQLEGAVGTTLVMDSKLTDWLSDHVYERDAADWEYEINNVIRK